MAQLAGQSLTPGLPGETHGRGVARDGVVGTAGGTGRAKGVVLAVNSSTVRFSGYRLALAVASSHMVVTEPVPDVIEELGWTGGEGCRISNAGKSNPVRGRYAAGRLPGLTIRSSCSSCKSRVQAVSTLKTAACCASVMPTTMGIPTARSAAC